MRLIDADRLKEAVTTDYYEHYTQCHDTDQIALIDMVENDIDESENHRPRNPSDCADLKSRTSWYTKNGKRILKNSRKQFKVSS